MSLRPLRIGDRFSSARNALFVVTESFLSRAIDRDCVTFFVLFPFSSVARQHRLTPYRRSLVFSILFVNESIANSNAPPRLSVAIFAQRPLLRQTLVCRLTNSADAWYPLRVYTKSPYLTHSISPLPFFFLLLFFAFLYFFRFLPFFAPSFVRCPDAASGSEGLQTSEIYLELQTDNQRRSRAISARRAEKRKRRSRVTFELCESNRVARDRHYIPDRDS